MLSLLIAHPDTQIAPAIAELLMAILHELHLFPTDISYAPCVEIACRKINQFGSRITIVDEGAISIDSLRNLKAPQDGVSGRILLIGESDRLPVEKMLARRQIDAVLGKPLDRDQLKNAVWNWLISDKAKRRRKRRVSSTSAPSLNTSILIIDPDHTENDRITNFALSLLSVLPGRGISIYRTTTLKEAEEILAGVEIKLLIADANIAKSQSHSLLNQRLASYRVLLEEDMSGLRQRTGTMPGNVDAVIIRPIQWKDIKDILERLI